MITARAAFAWLGLGVCACGGATPVRSAHDAGGVQLDASERSEMTSERPSTYTLRVFLFSKTAGYRHDAIEPARAALEALAGRANFRVQASEDASELVSALPATDVVVFLMTTGDVLDAEAEAAFERFVRGGGGFVGVHSAADTEYDWPFYAELIVSYFAMHGPVREAEVRVEVPAHVSVAHLPRPWTRSDEWYEFRDDPRDRAQVVLTLDAAGDGGAERALPLAWYHALGRGRAYFTALGHTLESWSDPLFVEHVARAIEWAGARAQAAR